MGRGVRVFPYFFVALSSAGLQAVLPQHQYAERPDADRFVWTSACLLVGALGRLVGVGVSGAALPGRGAVVGAALALGGTLAACVAPPGDVAFLVAFVLANALSQLVFDALDRAFVRECEGDVDGHVRAATAAQLLGFVVGPAWFGVLADTVWPHLALVATGTAGLVLAAVGAPQRGGRPPGEADLVGVPSSARSSALGSEERAFLTFGLLTYAAMFLFVGSFVPVVRDLYGVPEATSVAGVGLAGVNVVAVATVARSRQAGAAGTGWQPAAQLRAALGLAACLVLLALRPVTHVGWLYALGVPVGVAYGLFLLRARAYASARTLAPGRGAFLSRYNNLSNGAALVAFAASLLLSGVARATAAPFLLLALAASVAFVLGAAAIAMAGARTLPSSRSA